MARVISNLEVDRLREVDVAKEEKKTHWEAARATSGARGRGAGVVVGLAREAGPRLVARRPLRRQVNEAGDS